MTRDSLIKARSVGVFVLLYDGDNEGDEFGPEVEVLDAGTLLIRRDCLWLKAQRDNELTSQQLEDLFVLRAIKLLTASSANTHTDLQGLSDIPCCRGHGSCWKCIHRWSSDRLSRSPSPPGSPWGDSAAPGPEHKCDKKHMFESNSPQIYTHTQAQSQQVVISVGI